MVARGSEEQSGKMVFKEQGLEGSKAFPILQKKDLRRTVKVFSAKMVKITNYEDAIF